MSAANAWRSGSETMALPPYLNTMTAPEKRLIHGSASMSTPALARAAVMRSFGAVIGCLLGGVRLGRLQDEYAEFSST